MAPLARPPARLIACLPSLLPAFLLACLTVCLPAWLQFLPAFPLARLTFCLLDCSVLACLSVLIAGM